jgi:hypothetical protein
MDEKMKIISKMPTRKCNSKRAQTNEEASLVPNVYKCVERPLAMRFLRIVSL